MKNSALFLTVLLLSTTVVVGLELQGTAADSSLSGIIKSDTTWTKEAGPWNLTGNILIDGGATVTLASGAVLNLNEFYIRVNGTLIVKPGATINMKTMASYIQVNGILSARGTSENPIRINGGIGYIAWIAPPSYSSISFSASSTGWNDQTQSGSIIEYAVMNNTYLSVENSLRFANNIIDTGIESKSGSPVIYKNTIKSGLSISGGAAVITANTFDGGYITFYGENTGQENVVVSNNVICNSKTVIAGTPAGISFGGSWSWGGKFTVENNLITNCYIGVQIFSPNFDNLKTEFALRNNTITKNQVGIYISNSYSPTVTGNNIVGNDVSVKMVADYSGKSADISIPNNWWGTTSTAAIDQSIYDFNDDFNLGRITYTPILSSENTKAYPDSSISIPSTSPSPTQTPTTEQTSNSTVQPTTQPTTPTNPTQNPTSNPSNPTSNPTSAQSQSFFGSDWATAMIITLLTIVAVLLAVNILYMRRRSPKP
jgi:parallel beta-helix repeat protein